MKAQYEENIRIANDRAKLKDSYAKSLENILKLILMKNKESIIKINK